jgi:1-acyl-sn-glycerol-3-phosphate acyltransferase
MPSSRSKRAARAEGVRESLPPAPPRPGEDERLSSHHQRTREHGVNGFLYWTVRAFLQPFIHIYFRLSRTGREHVPKGPVILAANHRSFLDPFIVASCAFRPVYFVAKKELFDKRWQGWLLNRLGAFPVKRGQSDEESMQTALALLARGEAVVIFPEGTRHREGPLHEPRRGVGRLALESGAPVVPVAITGTEKVRRGWRIRPAKVSIRCGRPLRFPQVDGPSPDLAGEVTARIWPCVELQWAWLGGPLPGRPAPKSGDRELTAA